MDASAHTEEFSLLQPYSLAHSLNHVGMGRADPTLVLRGNEACQGVCAAA